MTAEAVPLPAGHLACLACGVPVPGQEVVRAEVQGRLGVPVSQRPVRVSFARCRTCSALRDRASELVAEHPRLAARIGSVAVDRLTCVLLALSVLGQPPGPMSDAELAAMLRHLSGPGAAVQWIARFVPLMAQDANLGTCSPHAWAHVTGEERAALRQGYAQVLRHRVARGAPPVTLPPPSVEDSGSAVVAGGACLMCGTGAVLVSAAHVAAAGGPASAARDEWTPKWVSIGSLGLPGPEVVAGHLCRECSSAVEHAGAMGPSAMERSLIQYLRPDLTGRLPYGSPRLEGVVGWGALVVEGSRRGAPAPDPSARRWAHVEGQDALRERLSALLG